MLMFKWPLLAVILLILIGFFSSDTVHIERYSMQKTGAQMVAQADQKHMRRGVGVQCQQSKIFACGQD